MSSPCTPPCTTGPTTAARAPDYRPDQAGHGVAYSLDRKLRNPIRPSRSNASLATTRSVQILRITSVTESRRQIDRGSSPASAGRTAPPAAGRRSASEHPRVGGEDQLPGSATQLPAGAPPRRRGGLLVLLGGGIQLRSTPADAGVLRTERTCERSLWRPPRRRGGAPQAPMVLRAQLLSSPPTRGCSAGRGEQGAARRVLPADAGVFRPAGRRSRPNASPPRRRGGDPVAAVKTSAARSYRYYPMA
jgi:hypothetical protein